MDVMMIGMRGYHRRFCSSSSSSTCRIRFIHHHQYHRRYISTYGVSQIQILNEPQRLLSIINSSTFSRVSLSLALLPNTDIQHSETIIGCMIRSRVCWFRCCMFLDSTEHENFGFTLASKSTPSTATGMRVGYICD